MGVAANGDFFQAARSTQQPVKCKQPASTSPSSTTHYAIFSGSAKLAFGQVGSPIYLSAAAVSARSRNSLYIAILSQQKLYSFAQLWNF